MIIRVAIKYDGKVHVGDAGWRHSNLILSFIKNGLQPIHKGVCGFIDDNGNFLTRSEAAQHAFDCGQLPNDKTCPEIIISEDLW